MDNDPKQYSNEELRQNPIVFFDGVCNLCNRSVNMILRADREKVFRFASLQGETAKNLLPDQGEMPEVWSMMLLDGKGRHERSAAMLRILKRLGGFRDFLRCVGLCCPRFIRNGVYRLIARYRYRWFGKKDTCRMPTGDDQAVFLP